MTAIQHVFLDLDGTLTDPAPGIVGSLLHAARAMGRDEWSEARLKRFIGPPLREAFAIILDTDDPDLIEQGVTLYRERFAVQGLFENAVFPGIKDALERLKARDFSLYVATSKAKVFADRIVTHFGLAPYLSAVYGAELSGGLSSKAELLAHAMAQEQVSPERSVMVGDRKHDILGANAHGMPSIGVLWGYGSAQELAAAKPNRIVIDIADLADVVSELSRSLAIEGHRGGQS